MDVAEETVQKVQQFVNNRQVAEAEYTKEPLSPTALQAYSRRLDATLQSLQEQVRRQEEELKKVYPTPSVGLGGTVVANKYPVARIQLV